MNHINSIAFDGVEDPELAAKTIGRIGFNCAEKSNDKTLSNQESLKYFMVTVKAREFLEAIISLDE